MSRRRQTIINQMIRFHNALEAYSKGPGVKHRKEFSILFDIRRMLPATINCLNEINNEPIGKDEKAS